jgi:rhodanese-related sulfurtransferase
MGGILSSNSSDCELKNALKDKNVLICDVRSPGEFSSGDAFTGAVNIPVDAVSSRLSEFGSDKNRPIITYCQAGIRAARAASTLKDAGFSRVFSSANADKLREISNSKCCSH